MKFLEAHQIVSKAVGGEPWSFLLGVSGTSSPLELYIRAHGAQRNRQLDLRTLAFNTLQQTLIDQPRAGEREVFLLAPWDLVPALDWRTGIPSLAPDLAEASAQAEQVIQRVVTRPGAAWLYLPAITPPVFTRPERDAELTRWLESRALSNGARVVSADAFQLSSYLSSGCPIGGASLSDVAETIVSAALRSPPQQMKVLVTDLDNVMWAGVIGEDGLDGIAFGPEGNGFRHFVYQTFLAKLQHAGVLLAAVSRNDREIALAPFTTGRMRLDEAKFVCIVASYGAKSSQIRLIAEQLNLGLDSMVFVDDNPLELAEVAAQLPEVTCVPFPTSDDGLPTLLGRLATLFASQETVTAEDRERTELYRRRLAGLVPSEATGGDLSSFLEQLDMKLTIHDRSAGDRTRAVQLINKTNQFNLNGRRLSDEEVATVLSEGGRLLTASLSDRHGDHGEILSCLIARDGAMESFVLSCRVFQRRVEHAFLIWLIQSGGAPRLLRFAETPRNEPMQRFLEADGFSRLETGVIRFDALAFQAANANSLSLFRVTEPGIASSAPAAGVT